MTTDQPVTPSDSCGAPHLGSPADHDSGGVFFPPVNTPPGSYTYNGLTYWELAEEVL